MNRDWSKYNRGASLVEVIIGSAILTIVFISLGGAAQYLLRFSQDANTRIRSAFLASEGIEVARLLRDQSWNTAIAPLSVGTPYYLEFSGTAWRATTTPVIVDGVFARTFVLNQVSRDAFDDIVSSGGTNDTDARKVTVTVTWSSRGIQRQDIISTYLTNLFKN